MFYTDPCNKCCYCRTGETQYCLNLDIINTLCTISCNKCCYCRTGETQYCLNPTIINNEKENEIKN